MKLVLATLCAGAVFFMLRFFIALLKEGKTQPARWVTVHFGRLDAVERIGRSEIDELQELYARVSNTE